MAFIDVELPDNVPDCHVVILRYACRVDQLEAKVEELNRDLALLRRELFGSRRERFVDGAPQASAGDDPAVNDPSANSQPAESSHRAENSEPAAATSAARAPRTSKGRNKRVIDGSIPREDVLHRLDEASVPPELLNDPRARRFFRFVREELELPSRQLRVLRHFEEVIVLDDEAAGSSRLVAASAPEPLIDRCYLGPGFLAYLVTSRFADHIPYYREEDILGRLGYTVHRATQWRWMRGVSRVVQPLIELMRRRTLLSHVLGIDETPCAMLCPDLGRTRSAYLYAQYGDATQPYTCFYFASHKTRENIQQMLGTYQGFLQSDAYICYELVTAASNESIVQVACWAHGRRKFEPLLQAGPHPLASWILGMIQALYDIEDRARNMTDSQRHALRQDESRPIVLQIKAWLDARNQLETPRSPLRSGVNYFLNRWGAFTRFLEDGAIPIDNNRTEAAIKGPVMGKKNWMFLGNEAAGETAATLYTLTMTCKRHCIDVQAYLLDVFRRIKTATPADLESLLPDRWIQAHPEARVRQRVEESHAAATRKRERRAQRRQATAPSG